MTDQINLQVKADEIDALLAKLREALELKKKLEGGSRTPEERAAFPAIDADRAERSAAVRARRESAQMEAAYERRQQQEDDELWRGLVSRARETRRAEEASTREARRAETSQRTLARQQMDAQSSMESAERKTAVMQMDARAAMERQFTMEEAAERKLAAMQIEARESMEKDFAARRKRSVSGGEFKVDASVSAERAERKLAAMQMDAQTAMDKEFQARETREIRDAAQYQRKLLSVTNMVSYARSRFHDPYQDEAIRAEVADFLVKQGRPVTDENINAMIQAADAKRIAEDRTRMGKEMAYGTTLRTLASAGAVTAGLQIGTGLVGAAGAGQAPRGDEMLGSLGVLAGYGIGGLVGNPFVGTLVGGTLGSVAQSFNQGRSQYLSQLYNLAAMSGLGGTGQLEGMASRLSGLEDLSQQGLIAQWARWHRGQPGLEGVFSRLWSHPTTTILGPILGLMGLGNSGTFGKQSALETLAAFSPALMTGASTQQISRLASSLGDRLKTPEAAQSYGNALAPLFSDPLYGARLQSSVFGQGDPGRNWLRFLGNPRNVEGVIAQFGLPLGIAALSGVGMSDRIPSAVNFAQRMARGEMNAQMAGIQAGRAGAGLQGLLGQGIAPDASEVQRAYSRLAESTLKAADQLDKQADFYRRLNTEWGQLQSAQLGLQAEQSRASVPGILLEAQSAASQRRVGRLQARLQVLATQAQSEAMGLQAGAVPGSLAAQRGMIGQLQAQLNYELSARPNMPETEREGYLAALASAGLALRENQRQTLDLRYGAPVDLAVLQAQMHPGDPRALRGAISAQERYLGAARANRDVYGDLDRARLEANLYGLQMDQLNREVLTPAQMRLGAMGRGLSLSQLFQNYGDEAGMGANLRRQYALQTGMARQSAEVISRLRAMGDRVDPALLESWENTQAGYERGAWQSAIALQMNPSNWAMTRYQRDLTRFGIGMDYQRLVGMNPLQAAGMAGTEASLMLQGAGIYRQQASAYRGLGPEFEGAAQQADFEAERLALAAPATRLRGLMGVPMSPGASLRLQSARLGISLAEGDLGLGGQVPASLRRSYSQQLLGRMAEIDALVSRAEPGERDAVAASYFGERAGILQELQAQRNALQFGDIGRMFELGGGQTGDWVMFGPSLADVQRLNPGAARSLGGSGASVGLNPLAEMATGMALPQSLSQALGGGTVSDPETHRILSDMLASLQALAKGGMGVSTTADPRASNASNPYTRAESSAFGPPR